MRKLILNFGLFKQKFQAFIISLLLNQIYYCEGYNYCYSNAEKDLCDTGKHIMCHEDALPKGGELLRSLPASNKIRTLFLDKHNEYRNKVSSGNETGKNGELFPKAARMREMLWNDELAYIARRHASFCSFNHDQCHNTKHFKISGQNIGSGSLSRSISVDDIVDVLNEMYNEKDLVENPAEMPNQLLPEFNGTFHFTQIVNDQTAFLGCGIALCKLPKKETKKYYILTCNYSYGNMMGTQIYKISSNESASMCSDWDAGKSEKYEHLCENNGKMFSANTSSESSMNAKFLLKLFALKMFFIEIEKLLCKD